MLPPPLPSKQLFYLFFIVKRNVSLRFKNTQKQESYASKWWWYCCLSSDNVRIIMISTHHKSVTRHLVLISCLAPHSLVSHCATSSFQASSLHASVIIFFFLPVSIMMVCMSSSTTMERVLCSCNDTVLSCSLADLSSSSSTQTPSASHAPFSEQSVCLFNFGTGDNKTTTDNYMCRYTLAHCLAYL